MKIETDRERELLKEVLIEEFARYIEAEDQLSPLSARILAHLIIDNHKGITFDDLVEVLKASKSSVFTNLNILLHKGRIHYYTLPGDRKKYYTVSPDDMIDRMDDRIKSCEKQITLCKKIIAYKMAEEVSENNNYLTKQLDYLESFVQYIKQYRALCLKQREELIYWKENNKRSH